MSHDTTWNVSGKIDLQCVEVFRGNHDSLILQNPSNSHISFDALFGALTREIMVFAEKVRQST